MICDYLIIGAGLSGLVMAEQLSAVGAACVLVDRRPHVGGNCHDRVDANGLLYHPYGPHYFHTDSQAVVRYLSRFTAWRQAHYRVRALARGRLWTFPINLTTYEETIGRPSTEKEFESFLRSHACARAPENSKEAIVSTVGPDFYNLFFRDYTQKQWGRPAEGLDASVCRRVAIRTNRDDRYFSDHFQAMPTKGYTAMCENILAACPGLDVRLNIPFEEARGRFPHRHLIFTGPLDAYFELRFGKLPFRSLRLELEEKGPDQLNPDGFAQAVLQINYTGTEPFTRTTEIKHVTGQVARYSNLVREFPADYVPGKTEPYYPIPSPDVERRAVRYRRAAARRPGVTFLGRLGTYRYLNMDEVVFAALQEAQHLKQAHGWCNGEFTPARLFAER